MKADEILFVGPKDEAMKPHSDSTMMKDRQGSTLMPDLNDAHAHLMFETLPQMVNQTGSGGALDQEKRSPRTRE